MAKIDNVDYEAIPGHVKQMRHLGEELDQEMVKAYKNIENLHSAWYGKKYNKLVEIFNNIIPQLNALLELAVEDIPFSLETVANNYAQADRGCKVTNAVKTTVSKIQNIAVPDDVGMKFVSSSVESIRVMVSNNFSNAIAKMDSIEAEYNKIQWKSEAADAFRREFTELKTNIVNSFNEIDVEFKKLMKQAEQDVQMAENSNIVQ